MAVATSSYIHSKKSERTQWNRTAVYKWRWWDYVRAEVAEVIGVLFALEHARGAMAFRFVIADRHHVGHDGCHILEPVDEPVVHRLVTKLERVCVERIVGVWKEEARRGDGEM
jgi:hypothetical protein